MTLLFTIFKQNEDFLISLAQPDKIKKDCPIAIIPPQLAWQRESFKRKIISCFTLSWNPREELLQELAHEILIKEIFGLKEDLAEPLLDLMIWHFNRDWELNYLKDSDIEKSKALEAMTTLTRQRYWNARSFQLNLKLGLRAPQICILLAPVVAKVPIKSIQYFIDIHSRYAFNSIRKSGHPSSDQIISYLYEILFLQQKIATSLHSFLLSIDLIKKTKGESMLIKNEMDAIINADIIFSYLKATIEKTIALIGYTYNIKSTESKKTHKQKIKNLIDGIPTRVKELSYYHFIDEFISTKHIEEINRYRTGLLHKKGISDLQPHNYFGKIDSPLCLIKLFEILHEQHAKNSAIIIATIALLSDELVYMDPPDYKIYELPSQRFTDWLKTINLD